ncbi:serine hydrolase domain-containing protein [Parvularcula maris]|uniref:Beta-lactamase family protein n=1 Tax=Parvularcula maris TaxID=2965077 RepID=A0A9X2RKP3_9PROT|nr:serine hydrolase domain-containing protein [Parvularcula maris]MCQ8185807.1 beta-lactamase family protein [Parvularcula maris]
MTNFRTLLISSSFAAALLHLAGCSELSGGSETSPPQAEASSVEVFDAGELIAEAAIPALSLAVIEGGEVVRVEQLGVVSAETGQPVTEDHLFQAASLSKPVMAYITMRLVDRELLTLDTPLHTILPSERFANQDYAEELTPRLLLSHQSGLPNWGGTPLEFNRAPGQRWGYSGEGYVYLQQVLSELTGLSLEEIARREVFEPLGMTKSSFFFDGDDPPLIVAPHNDAGEAQPLGEPYSNAASSLHTEAGDYARFMLAVLNGEGLSEASHREMLSTQIMMPTEWSDENAPLTDNLGWALGWGTMSEDDGQALWHWGDNGTYRAFAFLETGTGDGAVYFANSSHGHSIANALYEGLGHDIGDISAWLGFRDYDAPGFKAWRQGIVAEAAGDYREAAAKYRQSYEEEGGTNERLAVTLAWYDRFGEALSTEPAAMSAEEAAPYTGQYGPRRVWFEEGFLYYQREERPAFRLLPAGEHLFLLEGFPGFHLAFEMAENGEATALVGHYGDASSDRSERDGS